MATVGYGELVKIPQQNETVVESSVRPGTIRRTWFHFLQSLYTRGFWTPIQYAAGNFTASGAMTWTVQEADQVTWSYTRVGKTVVLSFVLTSTSIGGTPSTDLYLALPNAFVAATTAVAPVLIYDNGTPEIGWATVAADDTKIAVHRMAGGNFTASANNTKVQGQLVIEVRG